MRYRIGLVVVVFVADLLLVRSVHIERPPGEHVEERTRKDIDPFLRHYIVPHEIQFHADAIKGHLPFFLRCKGSKASINFTVPAAASKHLSLHADDKTHTVTIKLRKKQLSTDLIGRYTCSETINSKAHQATAHVFVQDARSVFTAKLYPTIFKQTGVHFFNVPCRGATWHSRLTCSKPPNGLKCTTPACDSEERCIRLYYTPRNIEAEKVFFDPQIGFALVNPVIPSSLSQFTCASNATPSQTAKIPFDSVDPDYVQIHQPSLSVTSDETVKLSCEIQYGTKVDRKLPTLFWFEDVHQLNLVSNETGTPVFQLDSQTYSRRSSIALRGFKPGQVYSFYCVRVSDQGLYSRSVDITCVKAPLLDVEISSSGSSSNEGVPYGSESIYDITIFTIPRSPVVLELSRDGVSLANDKRFALTSIANQENQFLEYTLTIHGMTFEDEKDLLLTVKSSKTETVKVIKPVVTGNPTGQISFTSNDVTQSLPWRHEHFQNTSSIYPYGILERESYRVVCHIRHRSDVQQPLKAFVQYHPCSVDTCLSEIINRVCQRGPNSQSLATTSQRVNDFQTQLISTASHQLESPSVGHQYLCCYEQNGLIAIAKALTILSRTRDLFHVDKPEFGLVTNDILTYRCEAHESIYSDLQIIYNDGSLTYERNRFDQDWRVQGTNRMKPVDLDFEVLPRSEGSRTMAIEVKSAPLKKIDSHKFVQCIGVSKRSNIIPNATDTYTIMVDDPVPLEFQKNLPNISKLNRKAGDNIVLDCLYEGRPKPKILWLKGKLPLVRDDPTLQFGDDNQSISITRVQASDTGYYTCELNNGHAPQLRRSFDLRVRGFNPSFRVTRLTALFLLLATLILLLLVILLVILALKYTQMRKKVNTSLFHGQEPTSPEDTALLTTGQLTRIPLPDNFASTQQIRLLTNYANGDQLPSNRDDFKQLGRGQFGVVYQVRLPEVGLVAAKLLPESIRRRERRGTSNEFGEEAERRTREHESKKKVAAEMLIGEIKVMHKAGKHVNIVALKRVAYPDTKFKFLFTGGPVRDEDSFYLMELCANGSLESMLKHFLKSSPATDSDAKRCSLYETLAQQNGREMTVAQACEQCLLTDDDLKLTAYQVACGVDYLNRRQIAHCDIAPRNVLVSSRFIMKICDFGLATWTTYKNYREQLARYDSVQLEKKTNDIATHNLTPELGRAFLHPSEADDRLLLNKSSIKSDVWSFGIFLWSLFLKCKLRPFHNLQEENFFLSLARVVSEGQVLRYIDYHPEIPRNVYAIIRECLVDEIHRPEMTRVRALMCHSQMLSRQAFEYYRSEYNRYQEENAIGETIERFGDEQGVSGLPAFDNDDTDGRSAERQYPLEDSADSYLTPLLNEGNQPSSATAPPDVRINDPKSRKPPPPTTFHQQGDSYL